MRGLEKSSMTTERNCKTASDPHKLPRDLSGDGSFFILLGKTKIVFWGKTWHGHLSFHALLMWAFVLGRQHFAFLKRLSLLLYLATHLLEHIDLPLPCCIENLQARCQSWRRNTEALSLYLSKAQLMEIIFRGLSEEHGAYLFLSTHLRFPLRLSLLENSSMHAIMYSSLPLLIMNGILALWNSFHW